ncbi:hypothetical protein [Pseudonocardia humida]|uniref:Prevent-host-death family protein n=1 Tax=Pseudonocardia humida TaxID=2800819 RepID=A0ABT1A028_9PSEU|nr:hypothetical protein [Pseudonocardia humida]MCO1656356.1 hypothetical protein [Pseudonocardia humida]
MTEPPRRIDVTRLPDDVVEFLDALAPGADLVITRDGAPIATVRSTAPAFGATGEPHADHPKVTVVATAMRYQGPVRRMLDADAEAHLTPATVP